MTPSPQIQDWDDPYALPRKPMSPGVPPAGLPGASMYGGFQPGQDTSWGDWWRTPLPDSAFNPQVTSSGATGMGDSAQPVANTRASGSLGGAAKAMGPPPVPQSPASVAPASSAQPQQQNPDVSATQGPPPIPQRMPNPMQDAIDRDKGVLADAPPKPGEHWYQRLGMAMLAATKLAPYAQQIVHPVWSQQMASREATEKELKDLTGAQEQERRGAFYQQQADEAKGRYLKVGTGVFDQQSGKWVTLPMDKSNLVAIDPALARERGLAPLGDGTYMVPASVAAQFIKPGKEPGGMYVNSTDALTKAGFVADPDSGQVYIPKEGVASYLTNNLKPPAAPTAEGQKIAFQGVLSKLRAEGILGPSDLNDMAKVAKAIDRSKTLTPQEQQEAYGYIGANTTPGAQGSTATIRMEGMMQSRIGAYIDSQTGQAVSMNAEEFNAANRAAPGRYVSSSVAVPAMQKHATFSDIQYAIDHARQTIPALGTLDAGTRAELANALSDESGGRMSTFLTGAVMSTMTPAQRDAVIDLRNLNENALAMRSVQGLGQGSDEMRHAIFSTLPNAKSPDTKYMLDQLTRFEGTVQRLHKGTPTLGGPQAQQPPSGGRGGGMSQDEIRRRLRGQQ